MLKIAIDDNGVGIDFTTKNQLFQVPSSQSFTEGIGLYLTKLACERLGGAILFNVSENGNTSFSVLFPITDPLAEPLSLN